jgi:hypothetical protein
MLSARISLVNSLLGAMPLRTHVSHPHITGSDAAARDLSDSAMKTYQFGRPLSHGLMLICAKDSSPDKVTRCEQGFKRITARLYPFFRAALAIQNAHHFCNRAAKLLNCSYS